MNITLRAAAITAMFALMLSQPCANAQSAFAQGPTEKERFEHARELYMQGSLDAAASLLKDFAADFPDSGLVGDAYYWLGKYSQAAGNHDEALELFRKITAMDPAPDKAPAAMFEIAGYWSDPANPRRDCARAAAEYTQLLYYYPASHLADDAFYYTALCRMRLGNYQQAAQDFDAFVRRYPDSVFAAPAEYCLGVARLLMDDTGGAAESFMAVRDKYPAGLYRGRAVESIELIERARQNRPLSHHYTYRAREAGLNRPVAAALNEEDDLYVADAQDGQVYRFGTGPGYMTLVSADVARNAPGGARPGGVAVGPAGRIYVTDKADNRVLVFSPDGELLTSFGSKGSEAGELDGPEGVAVDEGGMVYVADRGNSRVARFDLDGRFVDSIGNYGQTSENLLKSPAGLAFDLVGNLLVTDPGLNKLFRYDASGRLDMVLDKQSPGGQGLSSPAGIGVDAVGNAYVVNSGKRTVLVLDRELKPLMQYPSGSERNRLDRPAGIAVSGAGELFVTDAGEGSVVVLK